MKDLDKIKFCLGFQLEHLQSGILVHQSAYIYKNLQKYNMDKSYPSKAHMVVQSLDINKDQFRPKDEDEELLGSEVPYLSAIGALMYVANYIRSDVAFAVNLLARYSAASTKRHWTGVKNIFRYLQSTQDLGLFYRFDQDKVIVGYKNAGYISAPHNTGS
jgi:hypothetical protein